MKLVKLWSTYSTETLRDTVQAVHQLITMRILVKGYQKASEDPDDDVDLRPNIQDDEVIPDAVRFLRLVFYASLLGSLSEPDVHRDVKLREREAEKLFEDFCEEQRRQVDDDLQVCVGLYF